MTKTISQTPQGKTPAAPQKRRRKKFYRMKFIDSSDVICIANNFYSCNELSAHSNRDRSAFIQIWMMESGRKPHLVWTGYPRDLETFMKTKFKAVLKYNYYITKNTFCRPARTEGNIFTYNNIVIDIDDHESSSGMVAPNCSMLQTGNSLMWKFLPSLLSWILVAACRCGIPLTALQLRTRRHIVW